MVQLVWDKGEETESYFSNVIVGVLPMEFKKESGSVLLTPLGIEQSTPLGFGIIWEYRERVPFSSSEIQAARTFSALFTLQIAERFINEQAA